MYCDGFIQGSYVEFFSRSSLHLDFLGLYINSDACTCRSSSVFQNGYFIFSDDFSRVGGSLKRDVGF